MRRPKLSNLRGARLAIVLVAAILSLIIIGGALLWLTASITLSGGFEQWQLSHAPKPDFSGAVFQTLRAQRSSEFTMLFKQVATAEPYQQVATSSTDRCEQGEHTFAVRDSFAYACSLQQTRYYGYDGALRQGLLDLDKTLKQLGWASETGEDQIVQKYYDVAYKGAGSDYTAASLPGALYTKDGVSMEISWIERGDTDLTLFENNLNPYNGTDVYKVDKTINPQAVAATIFQNHPFGVSIALSKDYYSH